MIDVVRAHEMMPSVQNRREKLNVRIEEINRRIEEAAKQDKDNIIVEVYAEDYKYICESFEGRGFEISAINYCNYDSKPAKYKIKIYWG